MQERDMKANELDGASRSEYSKVIWMRNEGRFPKKTFRQEVDEANRRNDTEVRQREYFVQLLKGEEISEVEGDVGRGKIGGRE